MGVGKKAAKTWWNDSLSALLEEREQVLRALGNADSLDEQTTLAQKSIAVRAEFSKQVKEAKARSWEEFCDSLSTKPGEEGDMPYGVLRSMLGRQVGLHHAALRTRSGKLEFHPENRAELLARHYAGVSRSSPMERRQRRPRRKILKELFRADMGSPTDIRLHEVQAAIKRLAPKKAHGCDSIPSEFLKHAPLTVLEYITDLFTDILRSSDIPPSWGSAIISPIAKLNKDATDPSNHRPIGLLCALFKTFETVLLRRLQPILDPQLDAAQFGFRPGRHAGMALGAISHALQHIVTPTSNRDTAHVHEKAALLSLDLDKAFDRMVPEYVAEQLLAMGIPAYYVAWIYRYMRDTWITVRVNGVHSGWHKMELGYQQGSVLGPVLWLVVINPLLVQLKAHGIAVAFADDGYTIVVGKELHQLEDKICRCLRTAAAWRAQSFQPFSEQKTACLLVTMKSSLHSAQLMAHWPVESAGERHLIWADNPHAIPWQRVWLRGKMLVNTGSTSSPRLCLLYSINNSRVHVWSEVVAAWTSGGNAVILLPLIQTVSVLPGLGVHFDTQLTFAATATFLRARVLRRAALLRRISSATFGPSTNSLRTVARVWGEAPLHHAPGVYFNRLAETKQHTLATAQCMVYKRALGLPSSAPTAPTLAEAGATPIAVIAKVQAAAMLLQIRASPNCELLQNLCLRKAAAIGKGGPSWVTVATDTLAPYQLLLANSEVQLRTTSFQRADIQVLWHPSYKLTAVPRDARRAAFENLVTHAPLSDLQIWSDGSVTQGMGAAGIVVLNATQVDASTLWCPRPGPSTYAELMGILAGLSVLAAGTSRPAEISLCSDSMAALTMLDSTAHFVIPLVSAIWQHLAWVPSHCGLTWNEHADALAGSAEHNASQELDLTSGTVFFRTLTADLTRAWLDEYLRKKEAQGGGVPVDYFQARPVMPMKYTPLSAIVPKYAHRLLHQLAVGRCVAFHDFEFITGPIPCALCGHASDSSGHWLKCPELSRLRQHCNISEGVPLASLVHSHAVNLYMYG
eukprot:5468910-Amphidinium_carterae.1